MKKVFKSGLIALVAAGSLIGMSAPSAFAASNSNVTQVVSGGTLATDIRDASRVAVASPTFALAGTNFSFNCQTTNGSVGSTSQRIYVDNPGGANNGWTLTAAATDGATGLWKNAGTTQTYDYNDPTTSGCADGADADAKAGQMTVNPTAGSIVTDCSSCATTNLTKGSSTGFSQGTTDSITLINAAAASDDYGRWYFTGATVNQTIPAEQPVDSYTINLTLTATAS